MDDTDALLQRQAGHIKLATCPEANIARSRNIGIDNAAGEIIAFIDDDAIPSSDWLERLVGAYRDPAVKAAGGGVAHDTGGNWGPMTCSRCGGVTHSPKPPASRYLGKGADPFLYLTGCNMSFRRVALVSVGGFNEYLTYGYEDVEICRRFVDAGHFIAFLEDAYVHHFPQANAVRDTNGLTTNPYAPMRARAVFALQDQSNKTRLDEVIAGLRQASDFRNYAEDCFRQNFLSADQRESFLRRLEQGVTARMSAVTLATNSIPPLDGEGTRFFKRAGWGEASAMHYRSCLSTTAPPQRRKSDAGPPRKGEVWSEWR